MQIRLSNIKPRIFTAFLLCVFCISSFAAEAINEVNWLVNLVLSNNDKTFCAPKGTTLMEFSAAVAKFSNAHPELHDRLTDSQTIQALRESYPCKGTTGSSQPTTPVPMASKFNEALAAYQAKDYAIALAKARDAAGIGDARGSFLVGVLYQNGQGIAANATEAASWYEKAAQGGVAGAFSKLAQLYARGDGVPKSLDNAIAHARRGDQLGDPEGSFFLYVLLNAGPLSLLDSAGKTDRAKYEKLAIRPVRERTLDVEAKDALYRAAAKGYPLAQLSLALAFGGTVGEGNRERMLSLVSKIPTHTNQALKNYERIARRMEQLGQTYTSPQLFFDTQTSQTLAGMTQTCGIRDPKEVEKTALPELTAISISKPLSGAIFLPSSISGNERAYLVAGEWEENWTYRGCGNTANVIVNFKADGMGGAYMTSTNTPKLGAASTSKP